MSDIERAKFGRVAVATRAMAVWLLPGRLAARDAQEVRSSMSLASSAGHRHTGLREEPSAIY